ncbi:diguanylate phosphodiesterase [Hahella sp. CCB-MM4]|uniref:GAF domain-containing protein n=1 Tax=Hahella sp. (strain CCB-MM4) TaxID=1926491 RepID=UPI000B9A4F06|nr:GAF domain-containing protein [Hahella sp. CCB-MM4]OZG71397.1 diguanylate phosphodiesterase [Hahella sp. CCB-MM4]
MITPLPRDASSQDKRRHYQETLKIIQHLIAEERDWITILSTVCCELHQRFDYFHWTGFYRVVEPALMKAGPYQGGHGCLTIPFHRGVCGAAATTHETQLVEDVNTFTDHIACSSTTQSEIVVPVLNKENAVIAVLDVDSDLPAAFDQTDKEQLEYLATMLKEKAPLL